MIRANPNLSSELRAQMSAIFDCCVLGNRDGYISFEEFRAGFVALALRQAEVEPIDVRTLTDTVAVTINTLNKYISAQLTVLSRQLGAEQ
jgi:hypothetical protein